MYIPQASDTGKDNKAPVASKAQIGPISEGKVNVERAEGSQAGVEGMAGGGEREEKSGSCKKGQNKIDQTKQDGEEPSDGQKGEEEAVDGEEVSSFPEGYRGWGEGVVEVCKGRERKGMSGQHKKMKKAHLAEKEQAEGQRLGRAAVGELSSARRAINAPHVDKGEREAGTKIRADAKQLIEGKGGTEASRAGKKGKKRHRADEGRAGRQVTGEGEGKDVYDTGGEGKGSRKKKSKVRAAGKENGMANHVGVGTDDVEVDPLGSQVMDVKKTGQKGSQKGFLQQGLNGNGVLGGTVNGMTGNAGIGGAKKGKRRRAEEGIRAGKVGPVQEVVSLRRAMMLRPLGVFVPSSCLLCRY